MVRKEGEAPHVLCVEEQGKVFQQNVAVMLDSFQEEVALPSSGAVSKAALLSSVQGVELPRVEVLFLPFVGQRLAELSADLCGEVDGNEVAISGDHGLQRGKLLPKPKARMDINCAIFNCMASNVDAILEKQSLSLFR